MKKIFAGLQKKVGDFFSANQTFSIYEQTKMWCEEKKHDFLAQESITSTNDLAKSEAFRTASSFKIYFADQQTAGRGRGSHTWSNPPPGTALLATFSFAVEGAPQSVTAPLMGLAVYDALQKTFPHDAWSIKAPNDIYLQNKKVCGLLVEAVQKGIDHRLIVGLGINVFAAPPSIPEAGALNTTLPMSKKSWTEFIDELHHTLTHASRTCPAPNLTLTQRERLLEALNRYPALKEPYKMVSPFGDLINDNQSISWREL